MMNSNTLTKHNPLIFDIQFSSTVDGPGLRTTVFFKGCNLNCYWCHNPEGKKAYKEPAFFSEKCTNCGVCKKVCQNTKCNLCGECVNLCVSGARKIYGKEYNVDELLNIIKRDIPFYKTTDGGVTFSGGECMLYPDFIRDLAKKCKQEGISVAIDTAGNVPFESFEKVIPFSDMFLYDIKAITPELHKKGTGVDNSLILSNLQKLITSGSKIIIRVPVIPSFNDGNEMTLIKDYISYNKLNAEFLPYHSMGDSKKEALKSALNIFNL